MTVINFTSPVSDTVTEVATVLAPTPSNSNLF